MSAPKLTHYQRLSFLTPRDNLSIWEHPPRSRRKPAIRLARLPVIVCSASTDVEAVAAQLGTAGYLTKPYRARALLDLVDAHRLVWESEPVIVHAEEN